MAKRQSTRPKQPYGKYRNERQKEKLKNWLISLAVLVVIFAGLVTVNTFVPFSDTLPTWNSLKAEFESYFDNEQPMRPQTFNVPVNGTASVHFIDVGQGASVLILSDEASMLIDAGETDQGETVISYLKQQGVQKLDYLVATHPHSDHIGGMDDVIKAFDVGHIIMPELPDDLVPTTRVYENLLTAVQEKNLDVIAATVGESYALGGGSFTVLGPAGEFDDLNAMSICVKFTYGERRFLINGDMNKKAEQAVLDTGADVSADVMQMCHHGSKTSNSAEFLDAVAAAYYVAQVGYANEYGHPHSAAVNRAVERGGTVYRSDVDGTVVFTTDGKTLDVQTEKS